VPPTDVGGLRLNPMVETVNAVLFFSKKNYFLKTLLCQNCVVLLGRVLSGIRVCGLSAVGDIF
jgi:hypothetical protein